MVAERADWEDSSQLADNRMMLRDRYLHKMRTYEARYELKSTQVEAALASGKLRETAEVCDWLITISAYRKLGYALSA